MIEAGVLIGENDEPIYWHTPPGSSVVYLPDSRDLWEVIWEHRAKITGFAHSHPGKGMPHPSMEDLTTFRAIEQGLGKTINWYITSSDSLILAVWVPKWERYSIKEIREDKAWLDGLRNISGYSNTNQFDTIPSFLSLDAWNVIK